jgi:hypothetical protein
MADVFSSQSGVIEFKSPDIPVLVDVRGNLSVDNTIYSSGNTDLVLNPGSSTVVVQTGGQASAITTPNNQPLNIAPTGALVLKNTTWPEVPGTIGQILYMATNNALGWTSGSLELDPSPKLAGNLDVTGFEIFTAPPIPSAPTHSDLDMHFKSAAEIKFDVNASSPANTATMVINTSSNQPLSIESSGLLYLRGFQWPTRTQNQNITPPLPPYAVGQALTLLSLGVGGEGGILGFKDISGMQELYDDKSPQLGGPLDTLGNNIFSSNNTDINVQPGSRVFSVNSGVNVDTEIAPEDAQNLFIRGGPAGGSLSLSATGLGEVLVNGVAYPKDGGTGGQFLKTSGVGPTQVAYWAPAVTDATGSNGITATVTDLPSGRTVALNVDSTVIRTTGGQTINGSLNIGNGGDLTVGGNVTITGDLTVNGNSNVTQRDISTGENAIVLNADWPPETAPSESAGLFVYRGNSATVGGYTTGIAWDEATDQWVVNNRDGVDPSAANFPTSGGGTTIASYKIWHDGNTSASSVGLLDGQPGSYYLDASNLNTGIVPAARMPSYTGDVTSASGTNVNVLSDTGVAANTYGTSASVPRITVDSKGRITNAINLAIPLAGTSTIGLTRLATTAETSTGTLDTVATTPAGVKVIADGKQNSSPALTSIAGLGISADQMIYGVGANTYATAPITTFGRNLLDDANASAARTTLGMPVDTAAIFPARTTNDPNTVVLRDASGNLPGLSVSNASTAGALSPGATINGVNFTGASPITIADITKLPLAGGTMAGLLNTAGGVGAASVGAVTDGSLSVRGTAGAGAIMSFHRPSTYAINAGLDTDNVFRMGGFSDGSGVYRWTSAPNGDFTTRGSFTTSGNVVRIEGTTPQIQLWDTNNSILRYVYHDNGSVGFLTSAGGWAARSDNSGNWIATGDVTAFSDIRLKTNIEVIPDALNKVCSLRGVTYNRLDTKERQTGLIAQELYEVLPEAVHIGADEEQTMSVAYGNVIGLLVESIKELRAEIEALKADK